MRAVFALAATLLTVFVSAHVSIQPPTAVGNKNAVTAVRVPHAYKGHNTTNVTVLIPKGILSVKPQQMAGWQVKLQSKLNTTTNASVVEAVTWYGGNLPDELYQDFGLQVRVGDLPVGTVLYFPVVQETTNGTLPWTSVPDASGKIPNAGYPAAKLTIVNATTTAPSATNASSNQANTPAAAAKSSSSERHAVASGCLVAAFASLALAVSGP
ncbi:hypothetical protein H257_10232 [Aphanomyces astaci]|uniref:YncI copper-binding domain-containing protein n=1 Tax=Aphanomyces astaci TaxID=112090 RepID=W4G6S7_APHAT|nr:hypothetical protein H257_10232 [Aphanomyces astaci]ETV75380.1 hypothetical protein H257_10232 [Aphanomyces astaci]RHY04261.1 hypothetical protein DYB36_001059 [Aphanomyces astaci]RHY19218.1 hypothetical protein DYB25_002387 [Aphanomyces astaci]RHY37171.1 hypothetical protein DYB34_000455 [Aphanomyces astaci]RHY39226.1 hypothetical protein DYB30_008307 [Aphanomyces astaci]|eukprot:XP_009835014.1 hypothetical protein H257_10232 [Aphanomyces astaci]